MNRYIRLFSTFALLAFTHFSIAERAGFTDRLIVKMKTQPSSASIKMVNSTREERLSTQLMTVFSATTGRPLKYSHAIKTAKAHVIQLEGFIPVAEVQKLANAIMESDDSVEYAEPDYLKFPSAVQPNDTFFQEYQWHLQSSLVQGLNLPDAWEHTKGSSNVVVAVIDTGILSTHSDFDSTRILSGFDFVSGDWGAGTYIRANDGDGRDSDPTDPGDWVTAAESNDIDSPLYGCPVGRSSWHGTHVAGTIGAKTDNGLGVSGVDWFAKILPVRVIGKCGGYTSDIVEGIIWAAGGAVEGVTANANPAHIINLSLGGPGTCLLSEQRAIDFAREAGATVIVAAGNESDDVAGYSPANCDNVIVVGAHDDQGHLSDFSNHGNEVDVLAPGGGGTTNSCILSLVNDGTQGAQSDAYNCYTGTSMAAPHVSGLAALMLSRNPDLTPDQIEVLLKSSVRNFPLSSGCFGSNCGAGIADADAAIEASAIPYAVTGLIAQHNEGNVDLTWQDNSLLETGFKIEFSESGQAFEELFITLKGVTSYSHSSAKDGELKYRVSAVNASFSSLPSSVQTVDVPFKSIASLRVEQQLQSVELSWRDNSNLETGFEIFRAINQGEYELLTTTEQDIERYLDQDILDGTFYKYKVRSIKADAQAEFVEAQQVEVSLLAPTELQGVIEGGLLTLNWQDNSKSESAYQVQRSDDGISYSVISTLAENAELYTQKNDQTVTYYYRVKALSDKNGARNIQDLPVADSEYSNQILIEHKASSGSGAFSLFYVALLLVLSFYRRRAY